MRDIIEIDSPSIKLPEIEISDVDSNENRKPEYEAGQTSPLILLGGNYYSNENIVSFKISYGDSLLPTIKVELKDKASNIVNDELDFLETFVVYLRSSNNDFNPITMEFLVDDTKQKGSNQVITGSLFIKGIDDHTIKAYKGSSFQACREIAKELELGFASNITQSYDEQNWLRLSQSVEAFVSEVQSHAYVDDKSYVKIWIDPNYVLNYFDYGEANKVDPDDIPRFSDNNNAVEFTKDKESKLSELVLTDHKEKNGTSSHVQKYVPIDKQGEIERLVGYERNFKTEDIDANEYFEYNVKQTVLSSKIDRSGKNIRSSNIGFTTENTHRNYNHCPIQNRINSEFYTTKGMKVTLSPINPAVHCGIIVPIVIMNKDTINMDVKGDTELSHYNTALSWNYIVSSITYRYQANFFATVLECHRIRQDIKD